MSQTYGIESSKPAVNGEAHQRVRYVVVIESGGTAIARLFLESRKQVDEFDAGVSEVVQMTQGLAAVKGATGSEWDAALRGHSMEERASAEVYTLGV